jgi:hypothetical protein
VQQLKAGLDGVRDRNELPIEFASRDLLEQLPLWRQELPVFAGRPQQRLIMFQSSDARIIPSCADGRSESTLARTCVGRARQADDRARRMRNQPWPGDPK